MPAARKSILVVEDESVVAKDLQRTLVRLGYDAYQIVASADDAIRVAADRCPDLVLMDVHIQGQRDGIETAEILRAQFDVPVVYLTAHADAETIATEPHGYLIKPVDAEALASTVEIALYRHALERRGHERERWNGATLRSMTDAVISVDLAGHVTFMNDAAEALTGCRTQDALGRPARDVLRIRDEESLGREVRPVSQTVSPVIALGAVVVLRDVAEPKRRQQRLDLADRLASLGTMAGGVAHEVNNPLSIVVASVEYSLEELARHRTDLEKGGGDGAGGALERLDRICLALHDVRSSADHIAGTVAALKEFSRPVSQNTGQADVRRPLEWAIRMMSRELYDRARLVAEMADLPPVRADETRLMHVFVNLLANAAQAIHPGSPAANEVRVTARVDRGRVAIEVRDTGCGMTAKVAQHAFDPFFTTRPVGSGIGLGLSICRGIVTSLGGEIEIDSEVGKGTVVRVTLLPMAGEAMPAELPKRVQLAPVERRGKVMVIDDNEDVLCVVRRVLEAEHDVVAVSEAQAALDRLSGGESFDVILCDLMMPGITGRDFYEQLLAARSGDAHRIVFITGGATTTHTEDFVRSVPNRVIQKPFGRAALIETVRQVMLES